MCRVGEALISGERLFQSLGAALEKALSPLVLSLVLGATRRPRFADLRQISRNPSPK